MDGQTAYSNQYYRKKLREHLAEAKRIADILDGEADKDEKKQPNVSQARGLW